MGEKRTVLIVDDSKQVRADVAAALQDRFKILRAASAESALHVLALHDEVVLVISDTTLPHAKSVVAFHVEATARGYGGGWVFMFDRVGETTSAYISAVRPNPTIIQKPFAAEEVRDVATGALAMSYRRLLAQRAHG